MALSAFGNILLVSSACAIVLLVCIGVHGCGWPSSASIWRIEMAVFALMKRAPNSGHGWHDCRSPDSLVGQTISNLAHVLANTT